MRPIQRQTSRPRAVNTLRRFSAAAVGSACLLALGSGVAGAHTRGPVTLIAASHGMWDHGSDWTAGTVGTVGATSFTITAHNGSTWTVAVGSSTLVKEGSATIPLTALVANERVWVAGAVDASSSTTIDATKVAVVLGTTHGTVASVGSGSFVMDDYRGLAVTVNETGSTTYSFAPHVLASQTATSGDVKVGSRVEVEAPVIVGQTSLTATSVEIKLQRIGGMVKSITAGVITITSGALTTAVTTDSSTRFVTSSGAGTINSVTVGAKIVAIGTLTGPVAFSADAVFVMPQHNHHQGFGGNDQGNSGVSLSVFTHNRDGDGRR